MAVHKDCYAPIGLIQQGGPRRRKTPYLPIACVIQLLGGARGVLGQRLIQRIEAALRSED